MKNMEAQKKGMKELLRCISSSGFSNSTSSYLPHYFAESPMNYFTLTSMTIFQEQYKPYGCPW